MLKFIARILLAIPGWIAYLIPMTLLILLGFLIVPIAALSRSYSYRESDRYVKRSTLQFPDWLWLYNNEEDGIDGAANGFWPSPFTGRWAAFKQIVAWSAWRNSVGNARWVPFFGMTIADPKDMVVYLPELIRLQVGSGGAQAVWNDYRKTGPYLARYGWRFELRFPWNRTAGGIPNVATDIRYCWIGWRIAQQDTPNTGVGFAFQPWSKL
jgi:hypothetical protein